MTGSLRRHKWRSWFQTLVTDINDKSRVTRISIAILRNLWCYFIFVKKPRCFVAVYKREESHFAEENVSVKRIFLRCVKKLALENR